MTVRRVIFDLDGTLIDSVPGIVLTLTRAFEAVVPGHPLPPLALFVGPPVARMIPTIAPELSAATHAAVLAAFRQRYDGDGWRDVVPLPGALETLRALADAGIPADVATYKPLAPTLRILDALGLAPLVTRVRCVDGPGGPALDKAAMLTELIAAAGLAPADVVYVGDTPADRVAARTAGTRFVAVGPEGGALRVERVTGQEGGKNDAC